MSSTVLLVGDAPQFRISALRSQLHHVSPWRRRDALQAIEKLRARELLDDVTQLLQADPDPAARAQCAVVLGHFRYKPALPALEARLQDTNEDEEVRVWAAWAVGEAGTTREESFLLRMLASVHSEKLLRTLGGALKKVRLESVRAPARQVARQLQPPKSPNPRIRSLVDALETLDATTPNNLAAAVKLRRQIKALDEAYFSSYMEWLKRKPILERALSNPRAVYDD